MLPPNFNLITKGFTIMNKMITMLCGIKLESISLPAYIALSILANHHKTWLYIGETHAYFHGCAKTLGFGTDEWSYGAVGRILNVLTKRGLAEKEKDGQYVMFKITQDGQSLIERVEKPID